MSCHPNDEESDEYEYDSGAHDSHDDDSYPPVIWD